MFYLARDVSRTPVQHRCDQVGDMGCGLHSTIPGLDGNPRSPRQNVIQVQGALVRRRVYGFDGEVAIRTLDRRAERWTVLEQLQKLQQQRAVPVEQALDLLHRQAGVRREHVPGIPERLVALGSKEWYLFGAAGRNVVSEASSGGIHGI